MPLITLTSGVPVLDPTSGLRFAPGVAQPVSDADAARLTAPGHAFTFALSEPPPAAAPAAAPAAPAAPAPPPVSPAAPAPPPVSPAAVVDAG